MRKMIAAGLAALTVAGGLSAGPAAAQYHRDYRHHGGYNYYRHDNSGAAVAAGIAGLAIGAALANGGHGEYADGYYYGPPSYAYDYYYGPRYYGPRRCETREMWDPYVRGYVQRTRCW